ncbi:MAG: hypothetical protein ACRDRX_02545 [Pseudonocardiaceae bacterium]
MVGVDLVWWIALGAVALPLVLAFLVGNCVETCRARTLLWRVANERRDLEEDRRELEAGWAELEVAWRELEVAAAAVHDSRYDRRRRVNAAA